MAHAKTKGAKRAKLHHELSKLLDEELRRKGTSAVPAGEAFGKLRGLRETTTDQEIVWPPVVIFMNTLLEQDDNEKWIGMGNQELLEYFSTYAVVKARHSYGPRGHRGMSVLVFEATAIGYLEAERLHKHFLEQHTDRDAWERRRQLFYPGGKRQLYGYLATREDMDSFNQHCQGKSKLKFEMKSYQEMVVIPMKQMSEDNQQLLWIKNTVVKQERHKKALEQTFGVVSQKLHEYMEENKMVRHRTKLQHEENKQEMDYQEQFFKEQMNKVLKDIEEKEQKYKMLLKEERAKAKQFDIHSGNNNSRIRKEVIEKFIDSQGKGAEEFLSEREMLINSHEKKRDDLRRRYLEEEVEMEKVFEAALTALMEKYAPGTFQASSSA
ncbi:protein SUPPRESSOR OF GENE SILENCING 3-like protein [Iris pallida]|uniref:Protein SUPPRESSOR OF GENE SILENCING 3-like protein n=1 Tax=Iris pallida TaxID=29817 RepID=A0AAX6EWW2_IRIPA|nr:protein SUPPRESSOR OF GENE SILENCING 3-like protein [Iris pallida]